MRVRKKKRKRRKRRKEALPVRALRRDWWPEQLGSSWPGPLSATASRDQSWWQLPSEGPSEFSWSRVRNSESRQEVSRSQQAATLKRTRSMAELGRERCLLQEEVEEKKEEKKEEKEGEREM